MNITLKVTRYDYSELKDGTYAVFKDKYYDDIDISFSQRFCIVENEEQARTIVGQLNGLVDENEQLKKENQNIIEDLHDACNRIEEKDNDLKSLKDENKELKNKISNCKEANKKLQDYNNRIRAKNKRLHRDWDKIYQLIRFEYTEDEIIKELEK